MGISCCSAVAPVSEEKFRRHDYRIIFCDGADNVVKSIDIVSSLGIVGKQRAHLRHPTQP